MFLPVSVWCETAQPVVLLMVTLCCDTAQALVLPMMVSFVVTLAKLWCH